MRKITKRSAVVAGISAVVIAGGAAAWAAGWGIEGTGKADAKGAQIKALTATSVFDKNLYPDVTAELTTIMKNPNEFKVQLTGNAAVTGATVTPADTNADTCEAALVTPGMFNTSFPGTPEIPAGATDFEVKANVTIGSIPKACAGKTIKINYSFDGVSKA